MRIFVTGVAGFIGYHIAKSLLEDNHEVWGIDTLNDYYDPTLKEDRYLELVNLGLGRLPPHESIDQAIDYVKPDTVIHLAAYAGVRYSMEYPELYIKNNINFTQDLISACQSHSVPKVVYASTSSVMAGNPLPWSEDQAVDQQLNPYAATKRFNEQQFQFSCIPHTIGLRFFTVYGPWGRPDMALFSFTKNIIEGKPITVFNNGDMIRDFTYIDDIIQGIRTVMDLEAPAGTNEIYNIGRGEQVQLMEFIREIEKNIGRKAIIEYAPMHPADTQATWSDTSKIQKHGYKPIVSIPEGVSKFVHWYKSYYGVN